mgnify:CR=1 FL=1
MNFEIFPCKDNDNRDFPIILWGKSLSTPLMINYICVDRLYYPTKDKKDEKEICFNFKRFMPINRS